MAQRMGRRPLADAGALDGRAKRARDGTLVQVPADALAGPRVQAQAGRREGELPAEFTDRAGRFPVECVGRRAGAEAAGQVALVLREDAANVRAEVRLDGLREHRAAIPAALAVTNHDDVVAAVEVLDAQVQAFEQPQTGA